ncbi:hypothetical protein [Micromonospora sp. NPDC049801]|uniref:hypothetical protein n=1 Tax=unclassified Micromonospora TaxID=2617518 RepID=UPI003408AA63
MIIKGMTDAWQNRGSEEATMPAVPAGASPLDEMYLESIVGGAADSLDFFTFVCSSSVPPTVVCPTTSNLCA